MKGEYCYYTVFSIAPALSGVLEVSWAGPTGEVIGSDMIAAFELQVRLLPFISCDFYVVQTSKRDHGRGGGGAAGGFCRRQDGFGQA